MSKLIVTEFVTLDGVMEGPGPDDPFDKAGWTIPYVNDEFLKFKLDEIMAAGSLLLGRKTYEGFATAWPSRTDEVGFADKMNSMPKYVISTTVEDSNWDNTTIVQGEVVEEVKKLKERETSDILVCGSGHLVQTLIKARLVDEYRLLVYPVVLGSGQLMFTEGAEAKLKLIHSQTFATGVVLLTYVPQEI